VHYSTLLSRLPLAALFWLAIGSALASEQWLLLARHGECAPVSVLKRRFPDMATQGNPESVASFIRSKGFAVTSKSLAVPGGRAVEVIAPGAELYLVFVTPGFCQRAE
jgi:hypothetical protein